MDSGELCAPRFDNAARPHAVVTWIGELDGQRPATAGNCVLPPGCEHGDSFASAAGNSSEMGNGQGVWCHPLQEEAEPSRSLAM